MVGNMIIRHSLGNIEVVEKKQCIKVHPRSMEVEVKIHIGEPVCFFSSFSCYS